MGCTAKKGCQNEPVLHLWAGYLGKQHLYTGLSWCEKHAIKRLTKGEAEHLKADLAEAVGNLAEAHCADPDGDCRAPSCVARKIKEVPR